LRFASRSVWRKAKLPKAASDACWRSSRATLRSTARAVVDGSTMKASNRVGNGPDLQGCKIMGVIITLRATHITHTTTACLFGEASHGKQGKMAKVLVAEDDLMIADFLEEILIEAGHTVCGIARTVGEAAAMATALRPDLAIFDLCLAQGGRGTDIRARVTGGDRIGILFASGNIDAIRLTGADGDASIRKPYFRAR